MPATVFTHFFNEELLLPFWLRHHRELFDHGVLVDRGSTDRSLEIIRELVPGWDVVPSRNPLFDARDTDLEMMGHERRFDGWKVVLNVTEFVLADDLAGHLSAVVPSTGTLGVPCRTMVDAPSEAHTALDERPLFLQRHHHVTPEPTMLRFVHRESHGAYGAGRHAVGRPFVPDEELVVLKFAWSPWPQVRDRRLQIAQGIPEADLRLGMSWGLFFTGEELDEQFALLSSRARDLRDDPRVAPLLERFAGGYRQRTPQPVARVEPEPRWPEVVRADAHAWASDPAVRVTIFPLLIDVTGVEPAEADELMLLRGDFFLWDEARAGEWAGRFTELGRLGPGTLDLLGAAAGPSGAEALERFLAEPRRTTARVARDTPMSASRIAYRNRHAAAMSSVLDTANQLVALANENERLREELERLR